MRYSVVVPIFNDVLAVPELLDRLFLMAQDQGHDVNVVIVDDGSQEAKWRQLKRISGSYPERSITLIRLSHNHGQQLATLCGLRYSTGGIVVTMDADLQQSPEDIPLLLDMLVNRRLDLVYGVGMSGHNWVRRLLASCYRFLSGVFGATFFEFCSFRAMKSNLAHRLLEEIKTKTIGIDDGLCHLHPQHGVVHVKHEKRFHGKSGYTTWQLVILILVCGYYSRRLLPAATRIAFFYAVSAGVVYSIGSTFWSSIWAIGLFIFSIAFFVACLLIVFFRKPMQLDDHISVKEVFHEDRSTAALFLEM
jgi:glycosyltransferase involved in cell wall biosynthesis